MMTYNLKHMIVLHLLGIIIGVLIVGAVIHDANASPDTASGNVNRAIKDLKVLALRSCALRVYEDHSGQWERDDDARDMCAEFVSQIGRG